MSLSDDRSTAQLTTSYYVYALSVSLDYVVQFCSGSDLTYLAGPSGFCTEAPCRLLFTSCALFHKDQYWVHSTAVYFILRRPRGHSQGALCNNTLICR